MFAIAVYVLLRGPNCIKWMRTAIVAFGQQLTANGLFTGTLRAWRQMQIAALLALFWAVLFV